MPVEEILVKIVHLVDLSSRRQLCHLHPILISSQSQYCPSLPCSASLPLSVSSLALCSASLMWETVPLHGTLLALSVMSQSVLRLWKWGFLVSGVFPLLCL